MEGRYRVSKRLGSGAFGEIFKGKPATDHLCLVEKIKTGEFFAAKIVRPFVSPFPAGESH